jgi:hypothetical protein
MISSERGEGPRSTRHATANRVEAGSPAEGVPHLPHPAVTPAPCRRNLRGARRTWGYQTMLAAVAKRQLKPAQAARRCSKAQAAVEYRAACHPVRPQYALPTWPLSRPVWPVERPQVPSPLAFAGPLAAVASIPSRASPPMLGALAHSEGGRPSGPEASRLLACGSHDDAPGFRLAPHGGVSFGPATLLDRIPPLPGSAHSAPGKRTLSESAALLRPASPAAPHLHPHRTGLYSACSDGCDHRWPATRGGGVPQSPR